MLESTDANTLIEDWIEQTSNMPLEIKRMEDEIHERRQRIEQLRKVVHEKETSLQKWIRTHGSHVANPKEDEYAKVIRETRKQMTELTKANIKQGEETQKLLDKRVLAFDKGVKKLIEKGEIQEDPELPSLLRPPPSSNIQSDGAADLVNSQFLPTAHAPPANPYNRNMGVSSGISSTGHRAAPQRTAGQQGHHPTVPAISAIPAAAAAQKARESSAGATNKRPRIAGTHHLSIPPVQGNSARQSSAGPGTPKGNGSSSLSRAGSAGPRPLKNNSAGTKKVGPPNKLSRKSHLNKSSVNRIKRSHNGGSPSSHNDSEHSDGDSGSPGDDEPATPPHDVNGDILMIDGDEEDADDKKYCTCQHPSFGDMVACDNDACPYEWFHWGCVGISKAPEDSWFCNTPACNRTRGLDRK